ncbi:tRNA 2-thiouridine(34) synthase MnmA [candidate division TA06 bacterium]|uniref:tRNA-specific 2-thiouridylase MnmA n=1 Tax=candidate division TA06 bacterium TaxID=2250710 RepID=A0A933MI35_UNCT6|nr:tRNA 2-thiouridine(34) synthase MnmA [candidate division TA06 bacterium]
MMTSKIQTVAVAMSGGVDSSLAAALLVKKGYRVIGLTMRLFCYDGINNEKNCCSLKSIEAARQAAQRFGFPHYVMDCEPEFKASVVDYFIEQYRQGRTPNPCVACNQKIKFGLLLNKAKGLGCELMATGHYARIKTIKGQPALAKGKDSKKDQSYFLWTLTREQLISSLFPLGGLDKQRVRELATDYGLESAQRPESQEICFIPKGKYSDFMKKEIGSRPGPIGNRQGQILGQHQGIANYTIGQRGGLRIALGRPQYVVSIDSAQNKITVGEDADLMTNRLLATDVNWITNQPKRVVKAVVKIRRQHAGAEAVVIALDGHRAEVSFKNPQRAVTPGQSAVFYKGDLVLGGGVIESNNSQWH